MLKKILRPPTAAIVFCCLVAPQWRCSQAGSTGDDRKVQYHLDRTATNVGINTLYLTLASPEEFNFSIDGLGFEADVPMGERVAIRNSIGLTADKVGTFSINLKIFYQDGSVMLEDNLTWRYSTGVPPDPIVLFSEDATNDQEVTLLLPDDLEEDTQELWVEGSIIDDDRRWHNIDEDNSVTINVTGDDGYKDLTVKYRNVFGTESSPADFRILKKSVGPSNCVISVNTTVTSTGSVLIYMAAENDGKLYYLFSGDVLGSSNNWRSFTSNTSVSATIIDNDHVNKIKVQVRDLARNFCPVKNLSITYDENHSSTRIRVQDDALWTDSEAITVLPELDYVPSDEVKMFIHGNIADSASTFSWIDYRSSVDVQLTPVNGNRFVRVKYKINGEETTVHSVAIFLKPFVTIQGTSAPYTLVLSEIVDLDSITISGCTQSYQNIAPVTTATCTPTGASVSVRYNLSDGTSVTKSAAF